MGSYTSENQYSIDQNRSRALSSDAASHDQWCIQIGAHLNNPEILWGLYVCLLYTEWPPAKMLALSKINAAEVKLCKR